MTAVRRAARRDRPPPHLRAPRHHPGVQRGGVAARRAQGAARETPDYDVVVVSDGSTTAPRDAAHAAGVRSASCRSTSGSAARCAPGFATPCDTATSRGAVRRRRPARPARGPGAARRRRPGRRHGHRQPLRRGRRGHLRGRRHPPAGDGDPAVVGALLVRQQFTDTSSGFRGVLPSDARVLRATLPGRVHGLGRGAGHGLQRGVPRGRGAGEHPRPHRRRADRPATSSSSTTTSASSCAAGVTTSRGQRAAPRPRGETRGDADEHRGAHPRRSSSRRR